MKEHTADSSGTIASTNALSCGFCRAPESEVGKLIEGERINICDRCVVLAIEVIFRRATGKRPRAPRRRVEAQACSFCYRTLEHTNVMIRSDEARVCDQCLRNIVRAVSEDLRVGAETPRVLDLFGSAGPPGS